MNRFSRALFGVLVAASLTACGAPASEAENDKDALEYRLVYDVVLHPAESSASVTLRVRQSRFLLREMRFNADRVSDTEGDGEVSERGGRVTWKLPKRGGDLSWTVSLEHRRGGNGYDALLTGDWGLFRAEDLIPRASTRTLRGANSRTSLRMRLPPAWSVVTEYPRTDDGFAVSRPGRRFVQPSGWIVAGDLGVRRDRIAGIRVGVAAPRGHDVHRLDMLALLNWNLPELARILPELPPRLTIVSAGDPMWRGGLSAPQSVFLHADRPMISENGTSTLLHEVAHIAMSRSAKDGFDWVVEGFAEYYTLQLMLRSGTLTPARFEDALRFQAGWANEASTLCGRSSTGPITALAVTRLHALDEEISDVSHGEKSLDDVWRAMLATGLPFDLELLVRESLSVLGQEPDALHIDNLPGCRTIAADE